MKITCHCGHLIPDHTDDLPQKGHLIPDQNWNGLWDQIDEELLPKLASQKLSPDAASMQLRDVFSQVTRILYQCQECGRLYINDEHGKLHCYVPRDPTASREILSAPHSRPEPA